VVKADKWFGAGGRGLMTSNTFASSLEAES